MVVISSAGPPDAIGMYAVEGLMVFPSQHQWLAAGICWEIPLRAGPKSGPEDVDPKNWSATACGGLWRGSVELWPGSAHPGFWPL